MTAGIVRLILVLAPLLPLLAKDAIEFDLVANPRSVVIADRAASLRWQALFEPSPPNAVRTIALLGDAVPDLMPTLLAARLVYRGQPWTRRTEDASQFSAKEWRRRCRPLLAAALRELRFRRAAGLGDVYRACLTVEEDPDLAASMLVNLLSIDEAAARFDAVRLADPTRADALPGAFDASMRRRICTFLVDGWGADDEASRAALAFALRRGDSDERNAAVALLPPGQAPDLILASLIDILAKRRSAPLSAEDTLGFELLVARLPSITDPRLATELAYVALEGDRPLALASATVLAQGVPLAATMPWNEIAARIQQVRTSDPALRDGLAAMLMRLRPAAIPAAPSGEDPWRRLAEHRERLARWEWEAMAR